MILLELNNWEIYNCKKLELFKQKTGFSHHRLMETKTGFNIGIFSMHEILFSEYIGDDLHHGILKACIKNIWFLVAHLTLYSSEDRLIETRCLLKNALLDEICILAGDFNSLSRNDLYDEEEIISAAHSEGVFKFGENGVDYRVIDALEQDFHDAFYLKNSSSLGYTVPTRFNEDRAHFKKLRLDYFFVNSIAKKYVSECRVIRDELTEQISDHYPVLLELNFLSKLS